MEDTFFEMTDIQKFYQMGDERMHVLKNINLSLRQGEYLSILGPSGSGKSTLMNIIGCLDVPTSGRYLLRGREVEGMTETELAQLRSSEIGFIFQNSQLLPRLTAQKNVELPLIYAGIAPRERRRRAEQMLDRVGLSDRRNHYPNQLSGEFLIGETVNVYRGDAAKSANRIGRGKLSRTNPTAVSGSGSIVSFAVSSGDTVQRGDLLFETLDGEFDGLYMRGNQILAETNGTVAELKLEQGGKVEKNSVAAVLYPAGSMRIEAQVDEADLSSIAVGDPVIIELLWNQDEEVTYEGTISMISAIANSAASQTGAEQETSDSVTFTVYVDFTPDANTRYGMSALVSTIDTGAEEAADDDAE